LIEAAIDNIKTKIVEEIIAVAIIVILFLFHWRSALSIIIQIPITIAISFIILNAFGLSSNIMSLTGIALAIGVIVDNGIIMSENASSSNSQNPAHIYSKPGGPMIVTLSAKTNLGCRDTVRKLLPLPFFNPYAGNDTIIVKGYPFNLNGSGAEFYQWAPPDYLSDPMIQNPATNFPSTGFYTYVLTGTNKEGCTATDSVTIQVVDNGNIFIPNAFSPNGDGLNDNLIPRIVGYSKINYFYIFNRFGQQVFSSANENRPAWNGTFNGKLCDLGVYYYIINLTAANGANVTQKGDITIIR